MLSQSFFTSKTMNELPIQTMLTFAGLWCYVDDDGRAEDDVVLVKAAVWPRRKSMTLAKVEVDLTLLDRHYVICRYDVAGFDLLHVVNWTEHQKISHRAKSKLPPCSHHEPAAWSFFRSDDDPALEKFRRLSGVPPEDYRSDSTTVQLSGDERSLSADGSCIHGFPKGSECEMCAVKGRKTA